MIELIKGKNTTQAAARSGEGLFFVSRTADRFVLRSHRLQIEWDRDRHDVLVSDTRLIQGTLVQFEIRKDSRTRLEQVFAGEIFRIFASAHPDIIIRTTNAGKAVETMRPHVGPKTGWLPDQRP